MFDSARRCCDVMLAFFCSLCWRQQDDRGSMMSSRFSGNLFRVRFSKTFSILFALNEKYQRSLFDLGTKLYTIFYVANGYGDIPRHE